MRLLRTENAQARSPPDCEGSKLSNKMWLFQVPSNDILRLQDTYELKTGFCGARWKRKKIVCFDELKARTILVGTCYYRRW